MTDTKGTNMTTNRSIILSLVAVAALFGGAEAFAGSGNPTHGVYVSSVKCGPVATQLPSYTTTATLGPLVQWQAVNPGTGGQTCSGCGLHTIWIGKDNTVTPSPAFATIASGGGGSFVSNTFSPSMWWCIAVSGTAQLAIQGEIQ